MIALAEKSKLRTSDCSDDSEKMLVSIKMEIVFCNTSKLIKTAGGGLIEWSFSKYDTFLL